jgi:putative protease
MIVDGERVPLGDARYLLSPGDLYALHQVPDIVPVGISALKIEGRYKDADYVALATAAYRKAVDEAWAGSPSSVTAEEELRLEQVYSRGLGAHFITGTNHQKVVSGRAPRHRGVLIGRVDSVARGAVVVRPERAHGISPIKPGDGLVFDAADWRSPEEPEEGGRVYGVRPSRRAFVELSFAHGSIDGSRIRPGDLVWRTHDPDLDRAVRPFVAATNPVRKQGIEVVVRARLGEQLSTEWSVGGVRVEVRSTGPLAEARQPVDPALIRRQFERLGNTAYELRELRLDVDGQPFLPASMLNNLRRDAVEKLAAEQGSRAPRVNAPDAALAGIARAEVPRDDHGRRQLHLLVRTPEQLDAALDVAPASITLDYLDLYGLKPSVERVKTSAIAARVASPRVLKPGEERIADFLVRLDCPILVRSTGLLDSLRSRECGAAMTGDFSLNAANAASAAMFLDLGLQRIAPTHDLNAAQVADLARRVGGGRVEAIAYQHLPVFHTEHCVFCRFLSTGTTYKDCGRPCESHRVELRDVSGRQHPVMADVGCRNTVFGAEAQEASAHLDAWVAAGIEHYRLEFVHESADEVRRIARAFAETLAGQKTPRQLGQELRQAAPQGTTQGSLLVPKDYLALPILQ